MPLLLFALFFLLTLVPSRNCVATVNGKAAALSSSDVHVDHVDHVVQVLYGGLVLVNDTFRLSAKSNETVELHNFLIGFPYNYSLSLDYCFAYDASKAELKVDVDTGLGEIGFYGVNVIFDPAVNIDDGGSYNFTTVFVFSNLISTKRVLVPKEPEEPGKPLEYENKTYFYPDFPLYPSLTQDASKCNVTIFLPENVFLGNSSLQKKGIDFDITWLGFQAILNHTESLEAFTYEPAWLEIGTVAEAPPTAFVVFDVLKIKREITLNEWRQIHLSDFYEITNKAGMELGDIKIHLPKAAYDVSVRDDLGVLPRPPTVQKGNATTPTIVWVYLRKALAADDTARFTITYSIPWRNYIDQREGYDFKFSFSFLEQFAWTIRKLVVSLALPEGAEIQRESAEGAQIVEKTVFQETVTFTFVNVTPFQDLDFDFTYSYLAFWPSFYPTLWMGVLVTIVSAIVLVWRKVPKPPSVPLIPVPPKDLRSFVDAYKGKTRVATELDSIEEQLRKGKISRRQYKVRKKTLEGRLSALSRELTELREKIRTAGPRYADIMGQVEVAEALLEGVERDILRAEAGYRSGDISKGSYRRLIAEYERRKERAKTTIEGVLIRLREEIR